VTDPFEAALERGVEEFNRGRFFEAHDAWEELWDGTRGPERRFLEGLIHAAVGCRHLGLRNLAGARSRLAQAVEALAPWRPSHRNLDLDDLSGSLEALVLQIPAEGEEPSLEALEAPRIQSLFERPQGQA
jgi:hypothetical protein